MGKGKDLNSIISSLQNDELSTIFWINFLGFLSLYQKNPKNPKLLNYLKKSKVRIKNSKISELNELVLSLKLVYDKGMINTSKVDEITRFLAKLKTGSLDSINEEILKENIRKILKPRTTNKPVLQVRKIINDFLKDRISLEEVAEQLFPIAKKLKMELTSEILTLMKRLIKDKNLQQQVSDVMDLETSEEEEEELKTPSNEINVSTKVKEIDSQKVLDALQEFESSNKGETLAAKLLYAILSSDNEKEVKSKISKLLPELKTIKAVLRELNKTYYGSQTFNNIITEVSKKLNTTSTEVKEKLKEIVKKKKDLIISVVYKHSPSEPYLFLRFLNIGFEEDIFFYILFNKRRNHFYISFSFKFENYDKFEKDIKNCLSSLPSRVKSQIEGKLIDDLRRNLIDSKNVLNLNKNVTFDVIIKRISTRFSDEPLFGVFLVSSILRHLIGAYEIVINDEKYLEVVDSILNGDFVVLIDAESLEKINVDLLKYKSFRLVDKKLIDWSDLKEVIFYLQVKRLRGIMSPEEFKKYAMKYPVNAVALIFLDPWNFYFRDNKPVKFLDKDILIKAYEKLKEIGMEDKIEDSGVSIVFRVYYRYFKEYPNLNYELAKILLKNEYITFKQINDEKIIHQLYLEIIDEGFLGPRFTNGFFLICKKYLEGSIDFDPFDRLTPILKKVIEERRSKIEKFEIIKNPLDYRFNENWPKVILKKIDKEFIELTSSRLSNISFEKDVVLNFPVNLLKYWDGYSFALFKTVMQFYKEGDRETFIKFIKNVKDSPIFPSVIANIGKEFFNFDEEIRNLIIQETFKLAESKDFYSPVLELINIYENDINGLYKLFTENSKTIIKALSKENEDLSRFIIKFIINDYDVKEIVKNIREEFDDERFENFVSSMRTNLIILASKEKIIEDSKKFGLEIFVSEIDPNTWKQALKFNNLKISSRSVLRRKKGESSESYILRLIENKDRIENILNDQIIDPKIKVIELDEAGLEKETLYLCKFLSNPPRHGDVAPLVLKVFEVDVEFPEFKEFKSQYPDTVMKPVFHGTGSMAAMFILRYGFAITKGNLIKAGRMLGDGIYFTNVIDKSCQYVGDSGFTRRWGTKGYILEMEAVLGEERKHYDAAGIGGWDNIRSPEWCVYSPREQLRIYKAYLVKLVPRNVVYDIAKKHNEKLPGM